jgi:ATP-binding cassette subfamily C protein
LSSISILSTDFFMNLMWHFARTYPRHTLSMLVALLLAGIVEGIGLTALLPMLNIALDGTPGKTGSGIGGIVTSFLRFLGVTPSVGSLLLVVMAGVLLKSGLVLAADKKVGYTVAHVATDLRLALLRALMGTRWEYYLTQPVGSLANSASTEVMRASQAYLHGSMTLTFLIQSVVYAVIALLISWQATIVALLAGSLLLWLLNDLVRRTKQAGRKQTRYLQSLLAHLTDSLQSAKPLKAMGREQLAEKLLETDTVRLNKALRKQAYSKALRKSLQEPILMMLILSALFTALVLWHLKLPTVMVLVFLLARLLNQLGKVQAKQQDMAGCESAFWSLRKKIEEAELQREDALGDQQVTLEKSLRFDRVSFSYSGAPVLKECSLTIPAGSFTALIGPSGVGKTTLVDLVTGLLRPRQGEVLIDEVPMAQIDIRFWRRQIGYVPQDTVLLHDSILANITLGDSYLTEDDVREALRAAGVWEFVAGLPEGMQTVVGERGSKLSGGQRQRIAIARALAHRSTLLILDEATSALDPESEQAICTTLKTLKGRITILAISHQPALVGFADQVCRLYNGTVVIDSATPLAKDLSA